MTRQNWQTALGQGETDSDWAVINGSQGKGGWGSEDIKEAAGDSGSSILRGYLE